MAAHLGGRRRAAIKIGDKLPGMVPSYGSTCSGFVSDGQAFTATVVYIHPKRRFYTVEFDLPRGRKCRESYYFPDRAGASDYKATAMTDAERKQINRIRAHNRIKQKGK